MSDILTLCWPFLLTAGMMTAGLVLRAGWLKW